MASQRIYIMDSEPYYIGWLVENLDITKTKNVTWTGTIDSVLLGIKVHSPNYWIVRQLAMNDKYILHDELPKILDGNGCETKAATYTETLGGLTGQPTSQPLTTVIKNGENKFFIRIVNTNSWFRGQDYTITMWLDITYTGEIHFEPTPSPSELGGESALTDVMNLMMQMMFMFMFMSMMMSMMKAMTEMGE
jgi:hypothetical protein